MKTPSKIAILAALAVTVIATLLLKQGKNNTPAEPNIGVADTNARLPKLLDLGADKCIPCKMMVPVLEDLNKEYVGRMKVEFIDVWKYPDAGKAYNVEVIPTQIFFDADGHELFRHVGFFAKEDILSKWKDLGVDMAAKQPNRP